MNKSRTAFADLSRKARSAWMRCLEPQEVSPEVSDALAFIPDLCTSLEEASVALRAAQKEVKALRKLQGRRRRRPEEHYEPLPDECFSLNLPGDSISMA